jgi:hypothetical protein
MSLVRKWIEVPRLVNGVGIPEDHAMKLLRQLVTARHSIVHLKSPNTSFTEIRSDKRKRSYRRRRFAGRAGAIYCIAAQNHLLRSTQMTGFAKLLQS